MFEAEHHGVWRKRTGELFDVSPQHNGFDRILFLPDPAAVYDLAHYRPNIMVAETEEPNILKFVDLARELREKFDPRRALVMNVSIDRTKNDEYDHAKQRLVELALMLPAPAA